MIILEIEKEKIIYEIKNKNRRRKSMKKLIN